MSSHCIEKLPHTCGSSDALQVFQEDRNGKYTGYCFACDTFVPSPYGEMVRGPKKVKIKKSQEEIDKELQEINQLKSFDLPDRKLLKSSLEYFNVKVGVSEQDGTTPVIHYYPYYHNNQLTAYKARLVAGKQFWSIGNIKEVELFGWKEALQTGARVLYITEGELDAVALFQALKNKAKGTKFEHFNPAIVSLVNGASSAKRDIGKYLSTILHSFKEIVLVFDQDEQGRKAVEEVMQIIPHAQSVELPAKDANECIIKGFELALCNAVLFKRAKPKNTRILTGTSLIAEARKEPIMGLSWPWEGITKLTRGMRFGETLYLGAGVKMGKTTMVSTLVAHLIMEHKLKVFIAQPEETAPNTLKLVVGKAAKRIFHDPEIPFDYDAYDQIAPTVGDNLRILDLYQSLDWNTLRVDITTAVEEGCRAVFIDPITNLTNGYDPSQANTVLQEFAQELAYIAKDLNILVFMFCHLKAPESGPPHERGGKVFSSQFAGSRAMMRSCHTMLGLEGNKDPDLPEIERNARRLIVLEDRVFGSSGYINLFYDTNTGLYHEVKNT